MGARSMVHVLYTDDNGNPFQFRQQQQLQEAAGNVLASGTEASLPRQLRPRHIQASWFSNGGAGQAVGKFTRSLTIGSLTNPLWAHTDPGVTLPDMDSAPGVGQTTPNVMREFIVTGRVGEAETYG